jgi:hypothetical protein
MKGVVMKKMVLGPAVGAAVVAGMQDSAKAAILTFEATLSGPQEVDPNNSPGTGTSAVTIDTDTHIMNVVIEFQDLLFPTVAAHIHCCTSDPNIPVPPATQTPSFIVFPLNVTEGDYNRSFNLLDASTYNLVFLNNLTNVGNPDIAEDTLIARLQAGQAYVNIHTTEFPGGEIRGFYQQVPNTTPVPEPASLVLFGTALLGLAAWRKRIM